VPRPFRFYHVKKSSQQDSFKLQHQPHPQDSPIKSLRKINPNLRILRRPTNRNIRISRRLQTPQSIPNNENRRTETPKTPIQNARPGYERSDAVETQAPDESCFVAVVAQDPVGVAERGEGVGAEVGGL
jgi:hypothetical protein